MVRSARLPIVGLICVMLGIPALLQCARSSPAKHSVGSAEARKALVIFLEDPDFLPGLEPAPKATLREGPYAGQQFEFALHYERDPGAMSLGLADVHQETAVVLDALVDVAAPKGAPLTISASQALDIARRFCRRHCPDVWEKSDRVQEHVSRAGANHLWRCDFTGEKAGFENYISTNANVAAYSGQVTSYTRGSITLEPPLPKISQAAALQTARRHASRNVGQVRGVDLLGRPSRWIVWSQSDQAFHAAHRFELRAAGLTPGSGQTVRVSVDVVTGQVVQEVPLATPSP